MLLLIRRRWSIYLWHRPYFTFHYASTYTKSIKKSPFFVHNFTFHYASTYTWDNRARSVRPVSFTFHYASTYTRLVRTCADRKWQLYIPLCFYLYGKACWKNWGIGLLYIPLCFYLYRYEIVKLNRDRDFTFHYASTYTYRNSRHTETGRETLHSTMLLLIHAVMRRMFGGAADFTFHYASTYTRMDGWMASIGIIFTFHYASTYT